ncbi:ribokinase [Tomitella biformata]|uniref:ribokinase n=1 Tax=Tomitella biformata TaxID=630403 RepID=UPI000467B76E|nr:ribokinase [Tomitella biformata]
MSPRIVVVGSANMDLITTVGRRPEPGETVLGSTFATAPGGKGANQAIAAARAGGDVAFLGAVGTDGFGKTMSDALSAAGVDITGLRLLDGASGIASITVDGTAENSIIVVPGANGEFAGLTAQDRSVVASASVLLCQLEIPLATVIEAARAAHDAGAFVMLNPSPARELPTELLERVDLLIVNESEAEQIGSHAVEHVVTTLGAGGARYRGPGGDARASSPEVRVVDTTGAGDAFAGALAVAWAEGGGVVGWEPSAALRFGCVAGALATRAEGASAPSRVEIEEWR